MSSRAVFLTALLVLLPATPGSAQQVVRVTGAPCTGCVIERQRVLAIAGVDEEMVGPYAILARESSDRWLLATMNRSPGVVSVYDASGTRVQRFSRKGQGPGEHIGAHGMIVAAGDSLHLIDNQLRRLSVFSPTRQFIRSYPIVGEVYRGIGLPDGTLLVNANYPRSGGAGYPLHVLDSGGRILRSFGAVSPQPPSPASHALVRNIALGANGTVWTAWALRYELILWSTGGKVREIQRQAPWFPTQFTTQSPGRGLRPTPSVAGLWDDGLGQIWVLVQVPDSRWRPPPPEMIPQGERGPPIDYDREYDTIIEVIEIETGRLLASQRFDERLRHLMPGGFVIHDREDDDGEPYLDVWQLSFTNPGRR